MVVFCSSDVILRVKLPVPAGSAVAHARLQTRAGFRQEIRQREVL